MLSKIKKSEIRWYVRKTNFLRDQNIVYLNLELQKLVDSFALELNRFSYMLIWCLTPPTNDIDKNLEYN